MLWTFLTTLMVFVVMYTMYYDEGYTERYVWLAGLGCTLIVLAYTPIESAILFLSFIVMAMAAIWLGLAVGGYHE